MNISRLRATKRNAKLVLTAAAVAALVLTGCTATSDPGGDATKSTIKVGFLSDLTGASAAVGAYDSAWLELYEDKVNEAGGLNGHQIEFVIYDTALDPANAASGARRLIERDGVVAISCCISSSEALQVSAVGKELGVPIVGGAIVGALTDENEAHYGAYFRVLPGEEDTAGFNVNFVASKGWNNVAVSHSNLTYGQSGLALFKKLTAAKGMSIVTEVPIASDATEGSAQAALIQRAKPDAVLVWDYPRPTAVMAKALRESGYNGPFVANWSALHEQFWATAGNDIQNVFAHDAYDPSNPRAIEAIEAYTAKTGETPFSVHQLMQSAYIETILAGIEASLAKSDDVTGEAVSEGILSLDCLPTTLGPEDSCLTFGNPYESAGGVNPYQGGNPAMLLMKTNQNREWVVVE